ncbi:MAG TPA: type II toxin-antitoxin system VapC family toxin [Polyangia bacterium]|jgi:tRNA(fMet)-specific endonuclease VapC
MRTTVELTDEQRATVARAIQNGTAATTTVSVFELLSGVRTDAESRKVERLLAALAVVPLDEPASRAAAGVQRELSKGGARIATADALIAGICLARSAPLLTRNRAHFARVPGLVLQAETE